MGCRRSGASPASDKVRHAGPHGLSPLRHTYEQCKGPSGLAPRRHLLGADLALPIENRAGLSRHGSQYRVPLHYVSEGLFHPSKVKRTAN